MRTFTLSFFLFLINLQGPRHRASSTCQSAPPRPVSPPLLLYHAGFLKTFCTSSNNAVFSKHREENMSMTDCATNQGLETGIVPR